MRLSHAALAAALSLGLAPSAATAFCHTTTCGAQPDPMMCPACGTPIAWPRACAGLRVDPRVLPDGLSAAAFHGHVAAAARAWSSAPCPGSTRAAAFALTVLDDLAASVGYVEGAPNTNTVTFRDRWGDDPFHAPGAAAITIVTFSSPTGRILDADTELNLRAPSNPRGFVFATDGSPAAADLPTIVTHELGHAQGLAHSAERDAVMWYTAGRGERRRAPTDDDRAGLCAVYPPRDTGACEPDPGLLTYRGGGLTCGAAPGRARGPWAALVGLVGLTWIIRRQGSAARSRAPRGR